MLVKNTGRKIINFGQTSVLPGETVEINDKFKGDSTVKMFIDLGYIAEVGGKSAAKNNAGKNSKGSKGSAEKTEDTDKTDVAEGAEE